MSADQNDRIAVKRQSGDAPDWVQLTVRNNQLGTITNSGSIYGGAESSNPGMMAVGATYFNSAASIADYSSRGPTPDGRIKPDIVGAASVSVATSTFGGTSASAPHIAGLVALVKEENPDLTPAEIAAYLKRSALPRRSKIPNSTWGHGFSYLPRCDHACLP